jgi:cysteine desulfurase/selenocysteine lyase
MSTSELPFEAPDTRLIEQLANEYFKQTTSQAPLAAPAGTEHATLLPAAPVPYSAIPAAPYNLTPSTYVSQPLNAPAPQSFGEPPVSSAGSATGLPGTSPFSFLEDIRPLVSNAGAFPAVSPLPSVKIPTETSVTEFEKAFAGAQTEQILDQPADLVAPNIAGATLSTRDLQNPLSYSFVRDIRPLESFDAVPKLEPSEHIPAYEPQAASLTAAPYDVNAVRRDFPILEERVNGRRLVWLDNAATTQKPQAVIDRLSFYYEHENSNVHRAAHELAARSTDAYEGARSKVSKFINASSPQDIIFVRGATEGLNLIAQTWGRKNIQKDDEILITWLEHHANIVPWQMLCAEKGARLRVAPVDNDGQVLLEEYEKLLGPKTKLVSLAHVSNALGTVTPVTELVAAAHRYGAKAIVDGAQSISHMPIDVQAIDCDFFVFSGHKMFAPFGIGVVYGKPEVLQHMPPWQGGGNMIVDVTFEKTVYQSAPGRFEAGTGSIAPAVGLGAAIDYLNKIGMHNIARYEHELLRYATEALLAIPGLHLIGTAREKASVLSFVLDGFKTEEVGTALNQEGIAVRSGHHCAQPILRRFGLETTVRPSLALYNTCEEVDKLVAAIWNIKQSRSSTVI